MSCPALCPGIHVLQNNENKNVDGRDKPGHDGDGRNTMLQEITDFHDEAKELRGLLETLSESDWQKQTLFKDWTVNDVVLHLHCSDISAAASVRDAAEYEKLRAEIAERRKGGKSMIAESRERFPDLKGKALLTRWWDQLETLCETACGEGSVGTAGVGRSRHGRADVHHRAADGDLGARPGSL